MMKSTVKLTSMIAAVYLFAGYQELSAQKRDSLKEKQIEEVVMIGYGSRKKVDNTTAISSLNPEEITKTKVLNATQAIQGKAAGVTVVASDLPAPDNPVTIINLI